MGFRMTMDKITKKMVKSLSNRILCIMAEEELKGLKATIKQVGKNIVVSIIIPEVTLTKYIEALLFGNKTPKKAIIGKGKKDDEPKKSKKTVFTGLFGRHANG